MKAVHLLWALAPMTLVGISSVATSSESDSSSSSFSGSDERGRRRNIYRGDERGRWRNMYRDEMRYRTMKKREKFSVTSPPICEGDYFHFECPEDFTFLTHDYVFWGRGRGGNRACGFRRAKGLACRSFPYMEFSNVVKGCGFGEPCFVHAETDILGDPCPGYGKYLRFKYTCTKVYSRTDHEGHKDDE